MSLQSHKTYDVILKVRQLRRKGAIALSHVIAKSIEAIVVCPES